MAQLQDALEQISFYMQNYRHPSMENFIISGLYDLYPEKGTEIQTENTWPGTWPNNGKAGIYLFLDDDLKIVYIGKTNSFGYRLSSYFKYDENKRCQAKHNWESNPRYIVTVAVPESTTFESTALESFLLTKVATTDNVLGILQDPIPTKQTNSDIFKNSWNRLIFEFISSIQQNTGIMESFDSTKKSLYEILNDVHKGKIQLPDFQRGWVWDDNRI